ncbi:MAG: ornithine--oxo-acid transaminase [Candidatus Aminicenantes bacterium]|nr:ornithine--oxo-acid transaminase [Candidatus Aminicenantes bacterium]
MSDERDTQFYVDLEDLYGAANYHPLDVVLTRGKGIWLWDVEGKKYLDFLSGYSAVNHGHCHPRIQKVLIEQAKRLTLTSRAFRNDQWAMLTKEICSFSGYQMVLPMNSGAEAVETAIKAARLWGYQEKGIPENQAEIIVCENNFHGRTTTIISFSSEPHYRRDFGPFTPGFVIVPFGEIAALEAAITPNTAAFIVEPIQAEAGVLFPPPGFLKKAKALRKENHVLFTADEIQTGLGRTGKMFNCEYEGLVPDIMVIGKSLGGGFYPISAVLSRREILGLFTAGSHGSTFSANPLGSAAAREALRVLQEDGMVEIAAELGEYFLKKLNSLKNRNIRAVRGKGLLLGVELRPEAGGARRYCEALAQEGLLCKETHENVVRFMPPLIIKKRDLDWAFKRIKKVFKELE